MKICKCGKKHNKNCNLCNKCYFLIPENREKRKINYKKYSDNNKDKRQIIMRRHFLKKRYNITEKDYNDMLINQNYKCKICGLETTHDNFSFKLDKKKLVIDYNHTTGNVRGLLCIKCNTGIGNFNDNIELLKNTIEYLK